MRTQRLSHELEAERDARREEQSAIKTAERVDEPSAQAAAELQYFGWIEARHPAVPSSSGEDGRDLGVQRDIDELDPNRRYTAGYALEPIDLTA